MLNRHCVQENHWCQFKGRGKLLTWCYQKERQSESNVKGRRAGKVLLPCSMSSTGFAGNVGRKVRTLRLMETDRIRNLSTTLNKHLRTRGSQSNHRDICQEALNIVSGGTVDKMEQYIRKLNELLGRKEEKCRNATLKMQQCDTARCRKNELPVLRLEA